MNKGFQARPLTAAERVEFERERLVEFLLDEIAAEIAEAEARIATVALLEAMRSKT